MKIIVGVLTCSETTARRQTCNATWVRRLKASSDIRVVFLVGANELEARLDGDVLNLPCKDGYDSLVHKTKEFCRWALTQDFDYLFKCDDDTFVVADRFLQFDPSGRDYIGVDPIDDVNPRFASGGAGYWLSRKATGSVARMDVEKVSSETEMGLNAEDYFVYWALKEEYALHNDRRFQAWNLPSTLPKSSNEIITTHYIQPPEMDRLDKYFDELESIGGYVGYDRGNSRFARQFDKLQSDWMGTIGRNNGPIVLQESLSVAGAGAHQEARASMNLVFTYMRRLDGFENFRYAVLPYDLDYLPLVVATDPLSRANKASYVFSGKSCAYKNDTLFGVAPYRCNYHASQKIAQCFDYVDSSSCGSSVIEKITYQNRFRFAIACENLIADGYITENLLDCFQADTVPIFIGGWLPEFLESCVARLHDVSSVASVCARLAEVLAMPDDEYMEKLNRIRTMRFGHELYEMFSYRSFFRTIGIEVDTTRIRFDGSVV
jgi:Galactosyltransferase